MLLRERAPAKVNLTLHVTGRRPDGYHELESVVAFSGSGDTLSLDPGQPLALTTAGPYAHATGPLDVNLVMKAAKAFAAHFTGAVTGAFHLVKNLPAASGIGGGSSDAAAALRLLARINGISSGDPRLADAALAIGSDVPVCLDPRARMMRGRGEALGPPLELPPIFAVLINPGTPVETRAVFAAMGMSPGESSGFGAHPDVAHARDISALVPILRRARNDMEDAASVIAPVIGHVLAVLAAARGCRLARMSGSGATCFGLFETRLAAGRAARVIRRDHPGWWTKACVLR